MRPTSKKQQLQSQCDIILLMLVFYVLCHIMHSYMYAPMHSYMYAPYPIIEWMHTYDNGHQYAVITQLAHSNKSNAKDLCQIRRPGEGNTWNLTIIMNMVTDHDQQKTSLSFDMVVPPHFCFYEPSGHHGQVERKRRHVMWSTTSKIMDVRQIGTQRLAIYFVK